MLNADFNTSRGRWFLYILSVYFIHTSPRVLQQFLDPSNMTNAITFITNVAPVLMVLLAFQFIHTFNEVKWPVSWEDITGPAHSVSCHIVSHRHWHVSHVSHTSIYQQFELLLVQDILSDTISESSPLQVSDKRSLSSDFRRVKLSFISPEENTCSRRGTPG